MKRTPMKRGTVRVGAAARRRVKAGGPRVKGRPALPRKEWLALVADLIDRTGARCEHCRLPGLLDPHHVVKSSHGGEDSVDNIIMLRRACHENTDLVRDAPRWIGIKALGGEQFEIEDAYGAWLYQRPGRRS